MEAIADSVPSMVSGADAEVGGTVACEGETLWAWDAELHEAGDREGVTGADGSQGGEKGDEVEWLGTVVQCRWCVLYSSGEMETSELFLG